MSEKEKEKEILSALLSDASLEAESRYVGLYGPIDEENASTTIGSLLMLKEMARQEIPKEGAGESKIIKNPINLIISTHGGSAAEMFAIYDIMRVTMKKCEIHTMGIGKVMSAGVLLLAAGTKGKRKIGAYTRLMIHGVRGAQSGLIHDVENEMSEMKWSQQKFIEALVKESNLTEKKIKRLISKKMDIYIDAKKAIDYGIADKII